MERLQGEPKLIYEGLLRKSPPVAKIEKNYKWRKRHFKLWSNQTLEYYKPDNRDKPLKEPLALGSCTAIIENNEQYSKYLQKTKYKYPFCLKMPSRLYFLAASTDTDRQIWIQKLHEICNFLLDELPSLGNGTHFAIGSKMPAISSTASMKSNTTKNDLEIRNRASSWESTDNEDEISVSSSLTDSGGFLSHSSINYDVLPPTKTCTLGNYDTLPSQRPPFSTNSPVFSRLKGTAHSIEKFSSQQQQQQQQRQSINHDNYDEVPPPRRLSEPSQLYDEPPSNKNLKNNGCCQKVKTSEDIHVRLEYTSDRSITAKQSNCVKRLNHFKETYEQIESKPLVDDYIPIEPETATGGFKEVKQYRGPRRGDTYKNKNNSVVKIPPVLPLHSNETNFRMGKLSRDMTNVLRFDDEDHLHPIPQMESTAREPEKRQPNMDSSAPVINRVNKPGSKKSPNFDRSKKPNLTKQKTYVGDTKRFDFATNKSATFAFSPHKQQLRKQARINETDYIQHNLQPRVNNNSLPNNFNLNNMDKYNVEVQGYLEDEIYCNLDERKTVNGIYENSTRRSSSVDSEMSASTTNKAHIDYRIEALPEIPLKIQQNETALPYENVQPLSISGKEMTYVEVRSSELFDIVYDSAELLVEKCVNDAGIQNNLENDSTETGATTTDGAHYILVDPVRTEALQKLQKR